MICPKCQYQRTVSDTAPDWQCPACGIAYTKATPAVSAAAAKPDASPATNAPAVKKRLLTLAMWLQLDAAIALAAGGFYFRGHFDYPYREYPWILLAIAAWAIPSILVVRVIFTAYMRSAAAREAPRDASSELRQNATSSIVWVLRILIYGYLAQLLVPRAWILYKYVLGAPGS